MEVDLFESVVDCGCAAKVPAQQLRGLLQGLELPTSPEVVVGAETLDDAGVYRISGDQCLVQTVDFFPPVARNPQMYGRIAAANSLSDVYAMGGRPITALAVVCFPARLVQQGVLGEVLRGACEKLREADCALLGGHSIVDAQPKFGLAVTGLVDKNRVLTNAAARPADVLFLTKPLGTGVTIMAVRAGMASGEQETEANRVMAELNAKAAQLALDCGARCVTDVTGFGLLGHALQLASASGVALEIDFSSVPLLEGALSFAEQGLLSAAAYNNRAYAGQRVFFAEGLGLAAQDVLFDPQTSGGLLVCCPPERAAEFAARAEKELRTVCRRIGRVVEAEASRPAIMVGNAETTGG